MRHLRRNGRPVLDTAAVDSLLYDAVSGSGVLAALYTLAKQTDKRVTLASICAYAAMPSTGFLADVMSGKRRLSSKYDAKILRFFSLTARQSQVARVLLQLDRARKDTEREELRTRIQISKKRLRETHLPYEKKEPHLFHALDVFCAFGLFGNQPTRDDLLKVVADSAHLQRALTLLQKIGLVALNGSHYQLTSEQLIFNDATNTHIEYVKQALQDCLEKIDVWYSSRHQSHFESSVISVDQKHFEKFVREFKNQWRHQVANLETSQGDTVVRMTVGMFPVFKARR